VNESIVVALVSVLVSGAIGALSCWLAFRKHSEEDALGRAMRRTSALQIMSDEEFVLLRVQDECILFRDAILGAREKMGAKFDHFAKEADRIIGESDQLLHQARERRRELEPKIHGLSAIAIEGVVAGAYHRMKLAEAQLQRTTRSKVEFFRER